MMIHAFTLEVDGAVLVYGTPIEDEVLSLFRETDRRTVVVESYEEDGAQYDICQYTYECSVGNLCDRLDVMGFTLESAKQKVELLKQRFVRELEEGSEDEAPAGWTQECLKDFPLLQASTFDNWRDAFIQANAEIYKSDGLPEPGSGTLQYYLLRFFEDEGRENPFEDIRLEIRALLSAFVPSDTVVLDITPAINEYGEDPAIPLTDVAIENLLRPARATERIVVLTEGNRILGS